MVECRDAQPSHKSRSHSKFLVRKVPYRRLKILERSVNFTAIWCFLLDACELIYTFFKGKDKNCNNYVENIMTQRTKFGRQCDQAPGICETLVKCKTY